MLSLTRFSPTALYKRAGGPRDRSDRRRHRPGKTNGSFLVFTVLFVVLIFAGTQGLLLFVRSHRSHTTQSRFNVRSHHVLRSGLEDARLRLRTAAPLWTPGATTTYDVGIASDTVEVEVEHFGFP